MTFIIFNKSDIGNLFFFNFFDIYIYKLKKIAIYTILSNIDNKKMEITIKFVNDTRIVQVNKNMFNKLFIIYAHFEIFPNTNEIELDMKYDDFLIIHEMLNNKIDQWNLPTHIYNIAHKMGFIDDEIDKMNNLFDAKKEKNY